MSLAIPLRLTVLFRLRGRWGFTPRPGIGTSRPIDPCAMSRYLRRVIGLQDFPCTPTRDPSRFR